MALGSGFGNLVPIAMTLIGVISILRRKRNKGADPDDTDADAKRRRAEKAEMERRMASYLAQRETGGGYSAASDRDEQENGR
ncbi:hypothetical protein [Tabrizicola sp.]|uniref:hypothetical protein n=1 Tax=Tabrizicola sp. TaxID=2005166 RepID=UPI00286C9B94|nr:hypothetical protein [Tabrizicola sp.]